jgi:hypothetical protein
MCASNYAKSQTTGFWMRQPQLGALAVIAALIGCSERQSNDVAESSPRVSAPHRSSVKEDGATASIVSTTARFIDQAEPAGVRFTYRNGEEAGHVVIPESLGGGVGLLDYDRDGRLDLFLPGGGQVTDSLALTGAASGLFRGSRALQYRDVSQAAGVAEALHYSHGAAVADYDNDGFQDVLVTGYGGVTLHRNNGDGTFSNATSGAQLDDTLWSSSAAWGDVTGDGNLDLYVAHYVDWSPENDPECPGPGGKREICPPRRFEGLPDVLYVSDGNGTFRDGSAEAGLRKDGKGLGVLIADVDLDGHLDVYVTNDTVSNFLYRGAGNGKFEDASMFSGTALGDRGLPDGSMGVDLADCDLDGLPDLWVANYESESFALYRNRGDSFFQHVSRATGVTAVGALYVGWGTVFFDFDRDGDEDIFVSNGHVIRYPTSAPLRQNPLLFENDGGRFHNVAPGAGDYLTSPHMGRGVAAGDLDDDGDIDLVISHVNEPVSILANETPTEASWVGLRLIGRQSARDAIGARVAITAAGKRQTRQRKGGGSYASTSDPRLYFGVPHAKQIDEVEIRWPSGAVQTLRDVPVGRVTTIIEPAVSGTNEVALGD